MDKQAYKEMVGELIDERLTLKELLSKRTDELSHALQEIDEIYTTVQTTPNDQQLGSKVRALYFNNTEENI
tara:strand:+ start:313 stop:525 length:213 start_codon:yes stop_codon:yes gene_type:complete